MNDMFIKQVSVFVENKAGAMSEVLDILAEENIDMSALSVADTSDFGILRLILSEPEKAEKVLKEKGYVVKLTDVVAVGIEDKPGGLSKPLKVLKDNGIGIEYMYAFIGKVSNSALVVMKTSDPEKSLEVLADMTVDAREIYRI